MDLSIWGLLGGFAAALFIVPLFCLIAYAALLIWAVRRKNIRRARLRSLDLPDIDMLSGRDFERLAKEVYASQGYRCVLTPYQRDWGADLVIQKEGEKTVVQAKRCAKRVGVRAVQEVVAAKAKYGAAKAVVMTNSRFTEAAVELARVNRVRLVDRRKLEQLVLQMRQETGPESRMGMPHGKDAV